MYGSGNDLFISEYFNVYIFKSNQLIELRSKGGVKSEA